MQQLYYMTNICAQLVVKYLTDFWSKAMHACVTWYIHLKGNFHGLSVQTIKYCPQNVYKGILICRKFSFVY